LRDKDLYPNRVEIDANGPHAKEGNFHKTREALPTKEAARWARMEPGWLAQPILPSFDLDDPRAIYSPPAKSHTSIHSPFTAEEQRREGHHSREERVELVV
jgi:hypothetical protein